MAKIMDKVSAQVQGLYTLVVNALEKNRAAKKKLKEDTDKALEKFEEDFKKLNEELDIWKKILKDLGIK